MGNPGSRIVVALCLVVAVGWCSGCLEPAHRDASWAAMDETVNVEVYMVTDDDAVAAIEEVRDAVATFARKTGFGDGSGELERLNREARAGYYEVRDQDFYRCVLLALDYARASRGAFDPTVGPLTDLYSGQRAPTRDRIEAVLPDVGWKKVMVAGEARAIRFKTPGMRLDLGGVSRGFALDTAARAFAVRGAIGGRLELGSSQLIWGHPPGEPLWNIRVPDPRDPERPLAWLRLTHRGVAVSGDRADDSGRTPVFDASTGYPVSSGVIAAIAIADSAGDADAMSTALYASGYRRAADLLTRTRRVEAVLLVDGETGPYVLASGSLQGVLKLPPLVSEEVGGQVRFLLPPQQLEETPNVL